MSSVTRRVATGARGKRHNRSELFTRIIFAVNILICRLAAADKAGGRARPRCQQAAELLLLVTANALLQKGDAVITAYHDDVEQKCG
ncbi:hypothetical protein KPYH43_c0633 [Klebsiella pneumoniae]|nr:hypothetical protein KPYH43_c0633 [Klebsiella pneumoniae]